MLDSDTKRRIDTARDILVGKVPDPKSQVEQITIALIYKFMDDMDAQSEQLGGKRSFFADGFTRYGWTKLMRTGLGGNETLNLYTEAITRMPENPGIPLLFRDIFKNAYLPYRDPETLRNFLKVIDEFEYDHSERLGDAFEYLLSVLGSQGDAGQFRTPRHIIDFIVAVIDPKKDETLLDPACGTAGFLISSYKHVLKANTDKHGHGTLTPDDKRRLADNFKGYDISPDMVRLSLVNMYLHGFAAPHIFEYDTLTSQDRWNDYADVILANPPFMSPKGGIRPHNRFSVKSKRSEVLFVDYMAEHLTPNGRAGIIVPEGIIFQSQNAHKQLRKMLVEGYLVAVVSLPAGVFQPYSGVKTSILILDRSLAKKTDHIGFFKVENDGFDLGAQRRKIDKDDLPQVREEISAYLHRLRTEESMDDFQPALGLIVAKEKIAADGEYNLSGERYRGVNTQANSKWPAVEIGEIADVFNGVTSKKSAYRNSGRIKIIKVKDFDELNVYFNKDERGWIDDEIDTSKYLQQGDTLMINAAHNASHVASKIGFLSCEPPFKSLPSGEVTVFRSRNQNILPLFLNKVIASSVIRAKLKSIIKGIHIYPKDIKHIQIPLPPLEVQREIVAEIEGYQKVIDGARAIIDNYRPHIPINPERGGYRENDVGGLPKWPLVKVGEMCIVERGASPRPIHDFITDSLDGVNWIKIGDAKVGSKFIFETAERITQEGAAKSRRVKSGDLILSNSMSYGRPYIMATDGCIHDGWLLLRKKFDRLDKNFLYYILGSKQVFAQFKRAATGGVVNNLNSGIVRNVEIPLPPLEVQREIVAEIEAEQKLVAANRELVERMEKKIHVAIGRIWGR